jgi:hypothetical protein
MKSKPLPPISLQEKELTIGLLLSTKSSDPQTGKRTAIAISRIYAYLRAAQTVVAAVPNIWLESVNMEGVDVLNGFFRPPWVPTCFQVSTHPDHDLSASCQTHFVGKIGMRRDQPLNSRNRTKPILGSISPDGFNLC